MRSLACLVLLCVSLSAQAPAKKPITPAVLFDPRNALPSIAPATTWLPDGEHWLQMRDGVLTKVNALTGEGVPALDDKAFRKSLASVPGLPKQQTDSLVRGQQLKTDPARTGALITAKDDLWFAYFDGRAAKQLTTTGGQKEYVTFNAQGKSLAFVRNRNLFCVNLDTLLEVQLTSDVNTEILNGKADWVYEEEIFNRNGQAYWWSPDGTKLAFLRFDDSPVNKFTVAHAFPTQGLAETYGYPKPGDPNPTVKLCVAVADGSRVDELPLGDRKPADTLIARVGWTPAGEVYAYLQNRVQTWLDFVVWKYAVIPMTLFRDKTPAWIDDPGEPKFLKDGSFLFPSDRSGYKHLYLYAADGKLIRPVTQGDWEIQSVLRVDEQAGWVYVAGTLKNPNGSSFLRAALKDGTLEGLAVAPGTHTISVAPKGEFFLDRWSQPTVPAETTLRSFDGSKAVKQKSSPNKMLDEYAFGKYERTQIPLADGETLEAAITYPPDFDPKKKYPVWMLTYAGPHSATIKDAFSPRLFENVLATMGIVVFRVDPRSASAHSAKSAWLCYKKLGVNELKDLEAAADWIGKNEWCDKTRIGLSGHSFGGYITAYALTHSTKFSAGIAGAPVTDWRLYDSIYTERYMGLPSENEKAYDDSSVVKAAKHLHGKLLIIHGLIDDNVHFQNAMQLAEALQRANKPFEIMVYPKARHPIMGRHYQELQIEFIRKTMLKG